MQVTNFGVREDLKDVRYCKTVSEHPMVLWTYRLEENRESNEVDAVVSLSKFWLETGKPSK